MLEVEKSTEADEQRPSDRSILKELTNLLKLDAPASTFLHELLAALCRLTNVEGAVIMRSAGQDRMEVLAAYPQPDADTAGMDWITAAAKASSRNFAGGESKIIPLNPSKWRHGHPNGYILLIPIPSDQNVKLSAAVLVHAGNSRELDLCRERLEIIPLVLQVYELRSAIGRRDGSAERLRQVLDTLAVVNRSNRFKSVCMALCNEMATRTRCRRVSLGFLDDNYIRVRAISRTDKFHREVKLINELEAAMDECLDQDLEVIHPPPENAPYVCRAASRLSSLEGPSSILGLPLRRNGDVVGVLTLERSPNRPFEVLEEIETIRLMCDLCTPRLVELYEVDKWVGARIASWARVKLSGLLGPEHTWIKLTVFTAFFLALFLTFAKGDHLIEASFKFEAPHQQAVVAPFGSFLKNVAVDPGDEVEAGKTTLGVLDTSELRLKLAALKAEHLGYMKQMTVAMRDVKTADAQIAQAQVDKAAAEIRLIEQHIEQATLVAPISGRVVSEDLKKKIGAPVETGTVLFEIARIEDLRAELYVPEDSIISIAPEQKGELASVSHPDQKIRFRVERINPIAEVVNSKNVFRVRAFLLEQRQWMRPGMEGIAKIDAGRKSYIWIGTHRVSNWLRMKLWF